MKVRELRVNCKLSYEAMYKPSFRRWWKPFGTIVMAALAAVIMSLAVLAIGSAVGLLFGVHVNTGPGPMLGPNADNFLFLAGTGLLVPTMLLVVRYLQGRPAGTLHSVTGRIRWRWLAVCSAIAMSSALLLVTSMLWLYDGLGDPIITVKWSELLPIVGMLTVLVPLQAAGEEYVARGFLLQTLGAYGRWVGIVGSACAFAALHGFGTLWGFAAIFVGSVVWALMVIRTGGLEVSVAAHAATNLLAFLLLAGSGELNADDTTAADADAVSGLLLLGADLFYALAVLAVLRALTRYRPALVPVNRTGDGTHECR